MWKPSSTSEDKKCLSKCNLKYSFCKDTQSRSTWIFYEWCLNKVCETRPKVYRCDSRSAVIIAMDFHIESDSKDSDSEDSNYKESDPKDSDSVMMFLTMY